MSSPSGRVVLDEAFHYPSDLLDLLVDAISRLCRGKQAVLTFFKSCGIAEGVFLDHARALREDPSSFKKAPVSRSILVRLNEGGDRYLRQRREVIKRVTEWEDFSTCWPEDRLAAEGLVAKVRARVDKADAFTRMRIDREAQAAGRRNEAEAAARAVVDRNRQLEEIHSSLCALFSEKDVQRRGLALEPILNRYFKVEGVSVRESFTFREKGERVPLEQIDGVIELDNHLYLVEMKWWAERLSRTEVSDHMVRVHNRPEMRGLIISASGYTEAALVTCRDALQRGVFVLCELLRSLCGWSAMIHLRQGFARRCERPRLIRTRFNCCFDPMTLREPQ